MAEFRGCGGAVTLAIDDIFSPQQLMIDDVNLYVDSTEKPVWKPLGHEVYMPVLDSICEGCQDTSRGRVL